MNAGIPDWEDGLRGAGPLFPGAELDHGFCAIRRCLPGPSDNAQISLNPDRASSARDPATNSFVGCRGVAALWRDAQRTGLDLLVCARETRPLGLF